MEETTTQRIAWIDIAKAAAAWMVVTAHLLRQGALTDYLAAVSVVMFYMLAGVTLHPHRDLRAFLLRLLRRIVLPYLVVGLISIGIYRILGGIAASALGASVAETTVWEDLGHLLYGSSVAGRMKWNESLWFLPSYVVMILIAEGIERVSTEHAQRRVILYLVCGGLGTALIGSGHAGLPWHLETALLVLPFCGLGRYLGITLARWSRTQSLALPILGAGLLCYSLQYFPRILTAAGGTFSLRAPRLAGMGETYLFLLVASVGMLYLVWFCAQVIPQLSAVTLVGEHSLDVVLWNKFPVLALQVIAPMFLPGMASLYVGREDLSGLVVAAVLAIPCILLCLLWTRIYRMILSGLMRRTPH